MASKRLESISGRRIGELRAELARLLGVRTLREGDNVTAIEGLRLYRRSEPTACNSAAYQPSLVVFAQGEKQINLGTSTYVCDGSHFLLTSVDLPVVSQVTVASKEEPILGLILRLEMPTVREILSQHEFQFDGDSTNAHGMALGTSPAELLDACIRLLKLLDAPEDIPFLGG